MSMTLPALFQHYSATFYLSFVTYDYAYTWFLHVTQWWTKTRKNKTHQVLQFFIRRYNFLFIYTKLDATYFVIVLRHTYEPWSDLFNLHLYWKSIARPKAWKSTISSAKHTIFPFSMYSSAISSLTYLHWKHKANDFNKESFATRAKGKDYTSFSSP